MGHKGAAAGTRQSEEQAEKKESGHDRSVVVVCKRDDATFVVYGEFCVFVAGSGSSIF
jgi:hypothetical protein